LLIVLIAGEVMVGLSASSAAWCWRHQEGDPEAGDAQPGDQRSRTRQEGIAATTANRAAATSNPVVATPVIDT